MLPLGKHLALYFEFLFISMVMSPAVGSFDTVDEDVCENEDAVLTWQITKAFNVESKVLYKEETLVASWPKGYQLIIYPPYENRLLQIGESAIKIKNVTKSDSGTYKLILSVKSMTNTSEALIDLHVIVSPTDNCIVTITHEEDTLWAKVPQEECGIPSLIPYWRNVSQKLVSGNISVLQPEPRHQPRTYTACAVGKALKCFKGSPDKLCANSTLDALHSQNGSSSVSVLWILVPVILIIAALVIGLICKLVYIRKKRYTSRESRTVVYNPEEETPLTENETSAAALTETMMTDPDTSVQGKNAAAMASRESRTVVYNPEEETPLTENETSAAELTVTITTVEIQVKDTANNVLKRLQEILPMQQKQGSNDSKEDDEEVKGSRVRAKYPQFKTVKSRLESFVKWPSDSHLQPEELVEAGLFYQGHGDCVVCFVCGGNLSQWAPTDRAWEEHEKNYPKCEYVKLHKNNDSSLRCINETEGNEDHSREDHDEEERCILNDAGEQMKKESQNEKIMLLCKTCQKEKACIVFLPCFHFAACNACADKLLNCSVCQQEIKLGVKAYSS